MSRIDKARIPAATAVKRNQRAAAAWLATMLALAGCSSPPSGPTDSGSGDMPGSGAAQVRLSHFVAGALAFDVCIQGPSDPGFTGPIVRTIGQHSGGVPYGYISGYLAVTPSAYSVRVVAGSKTDCSVALGGLPDIRLGPLAAGRHYTVAAMGNFAQPSSLKFQIVEDDLTPQSGQARARFLNAAVGGNLDLGSGAAASFSPLFGNASYGATADVGGGQQYLSAPAQTLATYSLRSSGSSSDLATFTNQVSLSAGEVYTIAAVGILNNTFSPLGLAICDDTAPLIGGLTSCQATR